MRKIYQSFVFDLYGTLVDIRTDEEDPALWASFAGILARRGIDAPPQALQASFRRCCALLEERQRQRLQRNNIPGPGEIDILDVWRMLAQAHGVTIPERDLPEISRAFRARSTRRLRLYDGAERVLSALRQSGKQTVLLTNAQASFTLPELRQLGLARSFDHILISSRIGVKKPSPAMFRELLRLGLDPSRSLMIGNDDRCDCHGAAAAGIDSLYLRTAQSPVPAGPLPESCRQIQDLSEVLDCIG